MRRKRKDIEEGKKRTEVRKQKIKKVGNNKKKKGKKERLIGIKKK